MVASNETHKTPPRLPRLSPAPVARVPFECMGLLRLDEMDYIGTVGVPEALVEGEPRQLPTAASTINLRGRSSERAG